MMADGIRLCKAKKFRYKHMDMQELEKSLQEVTPVTALRLKDNRLPLLV